MNSGADFSPCRAYRYRLWRIWDPSRSLLAYVLLNPSTADADQDDPTLVRCETRARRRGYGGVLLVNLFAYCLTESRGLAHVTQDLVGRDNDAVLRETLAREDVGMVVLGWGNRGALLGRDQQVLGLIRESGRIPCALKVTKSGQPQHPLYVKYADEPAIFQINH